MGGEENSYQYYISQILKVLHISGGNRDKKHNPASVKMESQPAVTFVPVLQPFIMPCWSLILCWSHIGFFIARDLVWSAAYIVSHGSGFLIGNGWSNIFFSLNGYFCESTLGLAVADYCRIHI